MAIDISAVKEAFTWSVTYHNDSQVTEFDESRPDGRGFSEVDKPSIKALDLDTPELLGKHRVLIPDGAEPVFFRRRRIELNPNTEQQQAHPPTHCIGWKKGDEACYLFVLYDGSTLLTNELNAI